MDNSLKRLEATFDGQVFRPTEAVELQPNTKVHLQVTVVSPPAKSNVSFLEMAQTLNLSGPEDGSERIDEYLYGDANDRDE